MNADFSSLTRPVTDTAFAGSVPELYERYLVPLIFEPYAADLASRVAQYRPGRVLEIAAGTGVVTRLLAQTLPAGTAIVASDLNQPMLDQAMKIGTARPVEWQQADAMQLPFPDEDFDAVVCQFGAMFFPDKANAYAQARRVLRPCGRFIFSVWDAIAENEFADVVTQAMAGLFPDDPPRFLARTPHGHHDRAVIAEDLTRGGFRQAPEFTVLAARSPADSPRIAAIAYCEGTPLRGEIEARGPGRLAEAVDVAADAIARRFGSGAVDAKIQAVVIDVQR
jgi:SAM-dependent methyltransferase